MISRNVTLVIYTLVASVVVFFVLPLSYGGDGSGGDIGGALFTTCIILGARLD